MSALSHSEVADTKAAQVPSPRAAASQAGEATGCLRRAVGALVALQRPGGFWKGELETNVTMDAEDLLLREFLGIRTVAQTASSARWIRSRQRDDGTWANFFGGPPELSTTIESYVALRLAGDPVEAEHMRRAAPLHPGVRRCRAQPGLHPDLAGLVRPVAVGRAPGPAAGADLPAAVVVPLNIYDFACWARQTVVALTVVSAHRPVHAAADSASTSFAAACPPRAPEPLSDLGAADSNVLDRVLHRYERRPVKSSAQAALRRAERGSCTARRPTGRGAASSRRGSTR